MMASCEKCWEDSGSSAMRYKQLMDERKDNPCTFEEQAGHYAKECPKCKRKTIHQYCHFCLICNFKEVK